MIRQRLNDVLDCLGRMWCRAYHNTPDGRPNITLPQYQRYECLTCGREYTFDFEPMVWVPDEPELVDRCRSVPLSAFLQGQN